MIRIIKQGELNKDIKKITCKCCKAEFEADLEDFEVIFTSYNDTLYMINCPCCHHILFIEAD